MFHTSPASLWLLQSLPCLWFRPRRRQNAYEPSPRLCENTQNARTGKSFVCESENEMCSQLLFSCGESALVALDFLIHVLQIRIVVFILEADVDTALSQTLFHILPAIILPPL